MLVNLEDTVVLVTVVGAKKAEPGKDFLPLTVDYQERTYAAGKIPGGFFKREGRPSEKEILTCRLIDRPIRPLFPDGFYNEVQVVATVVSSNNEIDSDIPAMIGTSAALAISGIPFNGPIGASRVGYIDGQYVLIPTATELKSSQLDLVVAGTQAGGADGRVRGARVARGRDARRGGVRPPADAAGDRTYQPACRRSQRPDVGLGAAGQGRGTGRRASRELAENDLRAAFQIKQKQARSDAIDDIWKRVFAEARCR